MRPDSGPRNTESDHAAGAERAKTARRFGERLFEALFQGDVAYVLDRTMAAAQEQGVGVRIRLSMDLHGEGMTEVASLPWELMWPKDQRAAPRVEPDPARPLARHPRSRPSRSPSSRRSGSCSSCRTRRGPRRSTWTRSAPGSTRIWGPLPDVKVDSCAPVVSELLDKLRESDYHVIHYMGHGQFDQATGRGALVMAKEDGTRDLVSGEDLGLYLRDELRLLRLVFLNACKTGTTGVRQRRRSVRGDRDLADPGGGARRRRDAVSHLRQAAITFSETFYQSIAKGDPVDVAMAEGRKKLWRLDGWATPVLFLRSKDGVLFEPPRSAPAIGASDVRPAAARSRPPKIRGERGQSADPLPQRRHWPRTRRRQSTTAATSRPAA